MHQSRRMPKHGGSKVDPTFSPSFSLPSPTLFLLALIPLGYRPHQNLQRAIERLKPSMKAQPHSNSKAKSKVSLLPRLIKPHSFFLSFSHFQAATPLPPAKHSPTLISSPSSVPAPPPPPPDGYLEGKKSAVLSPPPKPAKRDDVDPNKLTLPEKMINIVRDKFRPVSPSTSVFLHDMTWLLID